MSLKLTILAKQARVGSHVTIRLTRGDDVSGVITELENTHVCIDDNGRSVTIFEDLLAAWEVHNGTPPAKPTPTQPLPPEEVSDPAPEGTDNVQDGPTDGNAPSAPEETEETTQKPSATPTPAEPNPPPTPSQPPEAA